MHPSCSYLLFARCPHCHPSCQIVPFMVTVIWVRSSVEKKFMFKHRKRSTNRRSTTPATTIVNVTCAESAASGKYQRHRIPTFEICLCSRAHSWTNDARATLQCHRQMEQEENSLPRESHCCLVKWRGNDTHKDTAPGQSPATLQKNHWTTEHQINVLQIKSLEPENVQSEPLKQISRPHVVTSATIRDSLATIQI